MRSTFRRLVAIAVLIASVQLLVVEPAGAHTGFEASDPTDDAVIAEPVDLIEIRFSGPAEPVGEGFVVLDPTGSVRKPDTVRADGEQQVWTLEFDPPLVSGLVGVRWTVQAPDVHPINGSFGFTVNAPTFSVEEAAEAAEDVAVESAVDAKSPAAPTPESEIDEPAERAEAEPDETVALDSFLAESVASSRYAGLVAGVGRFLGFGAATLGIGAIVFAAAVIGTQGREVSYLLGFVRVAGIAIVAGTLIELIGQVAGTSSGWNDIASRAVVESTLSWPYGAAVALRAGGGLLLFGAAGTQVAELTYQTRRVVMQQVAVGAPSPRVDDQLGLLTTMTSAPSHSWRPSSLGLPMAAALLVASFTFDGHTTSEGNRWLTSVVDVVHVAAGAVWAGGVIALAGVLWWRHRQGRRLAALELAVRFSVIAAVALVAAGLAGAALAVVILDSPVDLWSTPWGRLLIVKALAVLVAAGLGAYNHFLVIPWLNDDPGDDSRSIWLRNMVTGEAVVLGVVLAVTAALVGAAS